MARMWVCATLYMIPALLLTGCGPNPNEEQIRTTVDDVCEGPAELRYSRYGGFQIRVSPCRGKEPWSPVLYGENERMVTQEIDAILKRFRFRCSINTQTGLETGRTRTNATCVRIATGG